MAEKGLTLKVLFQAIDEMSGPLQKIGVALDNFNRLSKAAAASARATAAIGAVSVAGAAAGNKLIEQTNAAVAAAAPIDEALTRLKQLAPALDSARAAKDAFNLVNEYGIASMSDEIDALARATQFYSNYDDALKAADAANRLAAATHSTAIDALNQIGAIAKTSGEPVDALADKLAAMWKAAGGAGNLAQVERAWGMAKSHGENLEHFLAVMAEAQKEGISGRSLSTYYEESAPNKKGTTHWSQGTAAIHALLDKQAADIAAIEARIKASEGLAAGMKTTALASPAMQQAREERVGEAAAGARGSGILAQTGTIDKWLTSLKALETNLALAHPQIATSYEDLKAGSGYALKFGSDLGTAYISLKGIGLIFPTFLANLDKFRGIIGAGLEAGAGVAVPTAAALTAGMAAAYATPKFTEAVGAVVHAPEKLGEAIGRGAVNVTHNIAVHLHGSDATPEKAAEVVKKALDAHDAELRGKLKREVDRATAAKERTAFP